MDTAKEIETYLLDANGWVPTREICARFHVTDRQFRQTDDQPGLCSTFAISRDKAFKHVSLATTKEWLRFKHKLRKHGIRELIRIRDLDRTRADTTILSHARHFEKFSGQGVMTLEGDA